MVKGLENFKKSLEKLHDTLVFKYPDPIERMDHCRNLLKMCVQTYTDSKDTPDSFIRWGAMINALAIYSHEFRLLSEDEQTAYLNHRKAIIQGRK